MKLKTLDAIPTKQFAGFVIALLISFFTNIDKLLGNWDQLIWNWIPEPLMDFMLGFFGNTIILVLVIVFGIERPGINNFITKLIEALRDGKLTPEEKLELINALKDEFLGQWADLTSLVLQKKEEKITESIDLLE